MAVWLGKRCDYQIYKWEDTKYVAGPDYKEHEPVSIYCNHKQNWDHHEGNCVPKNCPLDKTDTIIQGM
jgi:hypothetical protein